MAKTRLDRIAGYEDQIEMVVAKYREYFAEIELSRGSLNTHTRCVGIPLSTHGFS